MTQYKTSTFVFFIISIVAYSCSKDLIVSNTFIDRRDNHLYKLIEIGNQTWMAENLAYIPSVSPPDIYSSSFPLYYVYDYYGSNVIAAKTTDNYKTYGVLYNWPAAIAGESTSNSIPSGVQGVCPNGWHVPSDNEWKVLEMYLGMSQNEADRSFWRGTDEGGKLKGTGYAYWASPNTGATDTTKFNALPGGIYSSREAFEKISEYATFWTTTVDVNNLSNSIGRMLSYEEQRIYFNGYEKRLGRSVRCIKD